MPKKLTLEWLRAALIRAAKTVAQTALGMLTVGAAFEDIQWVKIVSVALVAGIISMLTSVAVNLPEVGSEGTLLITPEKGTYQVALDNPVATISKGKPIRITVDSHAKL